MTQSAQTTISPNHHKALIDRWFKKANAFFDFNIKTVFHKVTSLQNNSKKEGPPRIWEMNKYIKWRIWKMKQLLLTKKKKMQNRIPVSIIYDRSLPNISNIITKNWNILHISPTLQKVLDKKPMITYKRNKNLGELLGGKTEKSSRLTFK